MPPSKRIGPLEDQIKQLTKDLNLARGRHKDDAGKIEDIEKRLAAKIEEIAILEKKIQALSIAESANDHLQQEIVRFKAELNQVKTSRKITIDDLCLKYTQECEKNGGLIRVVRGHEALLEKMHRAAVELDTQNMALRKALKAVL